MTTMEEHVQNIVNLGFSKVPIAVSLLKYLEENFGWRKSSEAPPPKDGSWFIGDIETEGMIKTMWNNEAGYFENKAGWFGETAIIYWMSIPPLPEKEASHDNSK